MFATKSERFKSEIYLLELQEQLWIPIHRDTIETISKYTDEELLRQIKLLELCKRDYKI